MTLQPPDGLGELLHLPLWVNTDQTKIPYTPSLDGEKVEAKANDATTWRPLPDALAAVDAGRFPHIGLEVTDGYLIGDIDHCRDKAAGKITPRAKAIVQLLNSYAEPSIGGESVHFIVKGPVPTLMREAGRQGRNHHDHELYAGAHYLRMSFRPFPGCEMVREIDQFTADLLYGLMFPDDVTRAAQPTPRRPAPAPVDLDDAALLAKAFDAHGGGDLHQRHHGQYLLEDKSADDFAYLGALRFWTQADSARMRRIALSSARVRDKWHTRRGASDWLDYSIAKVNDQGGEVYDPGRGRDDNRRSAPDTGSNPTRIPDADLTATLRADIQRLGDELRDRDRTIARLTATLAEVEEERDFFKRCLDCPDPVLGRAAPAIAEHVIGNYRAGAPVVQDGHEFSRVNFERAAEGKPINRGAIRSAIDRLGPDTPLLKIDATYQRNGRDVPTTHYYIACPVEERASVARLGLGLLERASPQRRHQGRKPAKVMPPAVAAQGAPVRREQLHTEKFYSLRDDALLATQTTIGAADYWTPDGTQITQEEARDWQVTHGARPAVESQHRGPRPQSRYVGTRPPAVEFQQKTTIDTSVETQQRPLPVDVPGQCQDPDCGHPATDWGYCHEHWEEQRRRHAGAWDDAAGVG